MIKIKCIKYNKRNFSSSSDNFYDNSSYSTYSTWLKRDGEITNWIDDYKNPFNVHLLNVENYKNNRINSENIKKKNNNHMRNKNKSESNFLTQIPVMYIIDDVFDNDKLKRNVMKW
ncbi:hypothetical protein A3Q56_02462 [Intoshia linei]|uniref:Uncharacterized protein n=1 Tax=Intoshia linei TaxID=1819745 RepID=A0A177B839_9BILA|nr:hypothetical protein A3Q56_02462 [Intoshia linei]